MSPGAQSLDARVVVQHRHAAPLSGSFTLGLLTSCPTPEGSGAKELAVPGYSRQPIHFGPPVTVGGVQRSGQRASFGAIGYECAAATHAAIFNENGAIMAYGRVYASPGKVEGSEIAFDAHAVQVRF